MRFLWLWLLIFSTFARADEIRLVAHGFSLSPTEITDSNAGHDEMISRFFAAFQAPATARLRAVFAPDGSPLEWAATAQKWQGATQFFRIKGVDPSWKSLRTVWENGALQTEKGEFSVAVTQMPPRELAWMEAVYPAQTFESPQGIRGALQEISPRDEGKINFRFSFHTSKTAPAAMLEGVEVRSKGQTIAFQTLNSGPHLLLFLQADLKGEPSQHLPLEFRFREWDPARANNAQEVEIPLQNAPQSDIGNGAREAKSQNALARFYTTKTQSGSVWSHLFLSGKIEKPLQVWRAVSFTTSFDGRGNDDDYSEQLDMLSLSRDIFFRPDGTRREKGETYARIMDNQPQIRLKVERRREFSSRHALKGIPVPPPGQTRVFAEDEWGDQTFWVRSIRFDAPSERGKRGKISLVLQFVPLFAPSEFKAFDYRLLTDWGQAQHSSLSPHWENGKQKRGQFEWSSEVYTDRVSSVDIAFDHLETEKSDLSEEILFPYDP